MKSTILFVFSIAVLNTFAQDTSYFDSNWNKSESAINASFYRVLFRDHVDTNRVQEFTYYKTGQLKSEKQFSNYKDKKLDGNDLWYDANGQLRGERKYKNGKIDGVFKTYWKDGKVKRHDLFKNDTLIQGSCYDSKGKKVDYYDYFISASFPNGKTAMMKFLVQELRYPENAIMYNVEGKVFIRFVVEKNGSITQIEVNRSVDEELDAEALRIVKKMPKWIPGRIDGEIVRMTFDLPVNFKLI